MNPIKIDLLERKKLILKEEIALIKKIEKEFGDKKSEPIIQRALLHAIQTAIAAIIDISQHIASEKSESPTTSYAEAIEIMGKLKIVPAEFASDFSRVAKLRNVMVHLYDHIDYNFIWSLIPKFLDDSSKFLKFLDAANL